MNTIDSDFFFPFFGGEGEGDLIWLLLARSHIYDIKFILFFFG